MMARSFDAFCLVPARLVSKVSLTRILLRQLVVQGHDLIGIGRKGLVPVPRLRAVPVVLDQQEHAERHAGDNQSNADSIRQIAETAFVRRRICRTRGRSFR